MDTLKLHYAPGTVAGAVAIALNEAQIDYEPVRVDFSKTEQRSEPYLCINPKGRVPAVETHNGIITETTAILEYVAALNPASNLVPARPFEAARMRSAMSYLTSTMHVNHAHGLRGHRWADRQSSWDDMKNKVSETMSDSAGFVESHMITGPLILGSTFSLADPYLFVMSNWLEGDGVNIRDYPKFSAFRQTMLERPSVVRAQSDGLI